MIGAMDPLLRYARQKQKDIIALIRDFVECESPSDDPPSVNRMVDLIAESVKGIAKVRTYPAPGFGKLLRCEFTLPREPRGKSEAHKRILALGHSDTVWPLGTLQTMKSLLVCFSLREMSPDAPGFTTKIG